METGLGLKSFVFSLSNIILVAKVGLVILGTVYPCLYGLVALISLVVIQRKTIHKALGILLIIIYLKLLLGSSFEFDAPSKICNSTFSDEVDDQEADEFSSSSEHFIDDKIFPSEVKKNENIIGHRLEESNLSHLQNRDDARCRFCSRVLS
ncbi:hypothetical protein EROM_081730 [Encephalitozoon romaleae SJ-2008]|uniref:Transmembrane protein n=1 Tax=Encephalitozoon romaleae (strain SJ-2008) TaxID=1178016 RepID=I7AP55_ENCRO|nr:hypothetical protein EROM_081730 [Encephalitozoon romaleae SJ-2008]AFN83589.1 hypothetical protein EROM_081730 [Encephalitozoon romaleae SJ-2008]